MNIRKDLIYRLATARNRTNFFNKTIISPELNETKEDFDLFDYLLQEDFSEFVDVNRSEILDEAKNLFENERFFDDGVQNRTKRQIGDMKIKVLYEFCKEPELGDIISDRSLADGQLLFKTINDDFKTLSLKIGSLYDETQISENNGVSLKDLNKLGYNKIFGQTFEVNLPVNLRFARDLDQGNDQELLFIKYDFHNNLMINLGSYCKFYAFIVNSNAVEVENNFFLMSRNFFHELRF